MKISHCPKCNSVFFIKNGFSSPVQSLSENQRQRYKCLKCGIRFSQNTHLFSYRLKKIDRALNQKIFRLFVLGVSNREIARFHNVSEECVRRRLDRMAKQALIFHNEQTRSSTIKEAIAYDGLENFAGSQYDPNNIQQAVGSESLFIYDFNFAPLNRKGRMSPRQKLRLQEIEEALGRYNPRAIRIQTKTILERLHSKSLGPQLELLSDEHFHYRKVVQKDLSRFKIIHKTISSKACRNYQNILFGVNHSDMRARQMVAAFTRETISFAKTAGRMVQKFALFMVYKNYMIPQFTKKHVRRPDAHFKSPAQKVGIATKLLTFGEIFELFPTKKNYKKLSEDWKTFYKAQVPLDCQRSLKFRKPKPFGCDSHHLFPAHS